MPLLLIGNGVHVLAHGWFPGVEYGRLPPDPYGMPKQERVRLARVTLNSIIPLGDGGRVLREAQLTSGHPAFDEKERRHLRDVRRYVLALYLIHAVGIVALVALALSRRTRAVVRGGLTLGALLTFGIAAFVGVFVAISPVGFLGGFHRVFFSGDSWRFTETETLRRLFPDRFWSDTAIALGALVGAQAAAILGWALWRRRQAIRPAARTAPHAGP